MDIQVKRVYQQGSNYDGQRILVDRLWPRGISKQSLNAQWHKELAPSEALRKALHQNSISWQTFRSRYLQELSQQKSLVLALIQQAEDTITLLYASKDTEHNNAVVLQQYMQMLMREE